MAVPIGQSAPYEARNRVDRQLKLGFALPYLLFCTRAFYDFLSQRLIHRGQFRSPLDDTPFEIFSSSSPLAHVPRLLQCDRGLVHRHLQQKAFGFGRELWSSRTGNEYADLILKAEWKHRD